MELFSEFMPPFSEIIFIRLWKKAVLAEWRHPVDSSCLVGSWGSRIGRVSQASLLRSFIRQILCQARHWMLRKWWWKRLPASFSSRRQGLSAEGVLPGSGSQAGRDPLAQGCGWARLPAGSAAKPPSENKQEVAGLGAGNPAREWPMDKSPVREVTRHLTQRRR